MIRLLRRARLLPDVCIIFFFNDTATTEIYTLSLHDALPILRGARAMIGAFVSRAPSASPEELLRRLDSAPDRATRDRKSTRLNSSHANISYAVFCLKKKMKAHQPVSQSRCDGDNWRGEDTLS